MTRLRWAVACVAFTLSTVQAQTAPPKVAEEVFKNIQALKGMPADQLLPTMQFIDAALGVECEFCHVHGKMESDEKKAKKDAREMIAMTMAINKTHFDGHKEVTCQTCHNGREHPRAIPPVAETDVVATEHHEARPATPAPVPAEVLDKYLTAVGGADALHKITSRVQKGTVTGAGPMGGPIVVTAKAPNLRHSVTYTQNGDSVTAYDGTAGWLGGGNRPARAMSAGESDAAALDADLYLPARLKELFPQWRAGRPEVINGATTITIMGLRQGQPPVRFSFDAQTGLLTRQVRYLDTPLGRLPTQIDYADYRDVDGVKIPFSWTIARPSGRFTVKVTDVKQNVDVDAQKFVKPAAPPAAGH